MNSTHTLRTHQKFLRRFSSAKRLIPLLACLAALAIAGTSARAQIIQFLANPGAETGNYTGWQTFNNPGYNFGIDSTDTTPHSGSNFFKVFGDYSIGGGSIFSGMFQIVAAHPGEVFNADGWAFQLPTDCFTLGGSPSVTQTNNRDNAFIEVTFQDSGGNTLARYRSTVINTNFATGVWTDMVVTNQYDPVTFAFIGTVTNLVAPANTVKVEFDAVFDVVIDNLGNNNGSVYWDDFELLAQTPPPCYITNVVPQGVILATNQDLTFSVVGLGGNVTNIQMIVTATSGLVNPTTTTVTNNTAVSTNWATISNLNSQLVTVSYPLVSNNFYSVSISAIDINLNSATASATFDTIQPVLVFEAEDFNFSGGEWITNVPSDGGAFLYLGVQGTEGIDEHDANPGNANAVFHYRDDSPKQVSTQGANEVSATGVALTRQKYINYYLANPGSNASPDTVDEEVGYNNSGDWLNYTRVFPTGNYNVYARLATDGSGKQCYFETVTSDPTQPNQTVVTNGTFSMTDNNWNVYQYVPLLDSFGNLVSVPLGGTNTVRVQVAAGGNPNENFYMVVPAVPPQNPVLQGIYPDGTKLFQATNHFAFTVGQGFGSAIPAGNINVTLNGVDVTPQVAFTHTATNWTGSIQVISNAVYAAVVKVTNSTQLSSIYTANFDTFSENSYMWEAEDFDFNGGSFIDNPVPTGDSIINGTSAKGTLETNSYYGSPGGVLGNAAMFGIDVSFVQDTGMTVQYRIEEVGTQVAGDYLRQKFIAEQTALGDANIADFNIGYYNGGDWLNYTRDYPAGTYYVWGRMAGGAGPFSGTTLCLVTNGWGTLTQATNVLGYFADPTAAGWQTWHWVPMVDANGHMTPVTFNGSTNTLKLVSGNNLNVNFLMLVPAAAAPPSAVSLALSHSGSQLQISFPTQLGHQYTVLYTGSLNAPVTWSTLNIIEGDGTTKTVTDTIGGAARFYSVSEQ